MCEWLACPIWAHWTDLVCLEDFKEIIVGNRRNSIFHYKELNTAIATSVPLLKIRVSVLVERVETSKVRLKITVSTRSTLTSNQILKRVVIKNNMHHSKENTVYSTSVNAAPASLGQQTSPLNFIPCNAIYYFIATLLRI